MEWGLYKGGNLVCIVSLTLSITTFLLIVRNLTVPEETGEDYPGPIITVNRSIWLPVSELWGYDNNLRENPPTGFDKKRFINVVQPDNL